MKNDNVHLFFFSLFCLQILNLPALLQNKNTRLGPFPWSVLQNPDRARTNQSARICLRLAMPYNNYFYCLKSWKKNVLSLKNGLTTTSYNVISRNHTKLTITERDSNCGKGWTNSYWKHHVLMLYPLGKNLEKPLGRWHPPSLYVWGLIPSTDVIKPTWTQMLLINPPLITSNKKYYFG